jgi:GNAT superfamily N-acetyltransferase
VAAVVFTDWGEKIACDPIAVPSLMREMLPQIWSRAAERIEALAGRPVEVAVNEEDRRLINILESNGFVDGSADYVPTWMVASERPAPAAFGSGFTIVSRESRDGAHHMEARSGPEIVDRLTECSLYRPDLDLAVIAPDGAVAAYALFWADPVTGVGLVEPMRTEDAYQRKGLASRLLAEGLDRLARAGCSRLKVSYEVGNEAARRLYLGSGFTLSSTDRTFVRSAD